MTFSTRFPFLIFRAFISTKTPHRCSGARGQATLFKGTLACESTDWRVPFCLLVETKNSKPLAKHAGRHSESYSNRM